MGIKDNTNIDLQGVIVVVVVYSGVRLELPIAMHTGIIKRNTQCMYR